MYSADDLRPYELLVSPQSSMVVKKIYTEDLASLQSIGKAYNVLN